MNTESKTRTNFKVIAAFVFGVALVYFLVNTVTQNRFQELESQARLLISEQQSVLAVIAETTARNGADAVTERVVRDCTVAERTTFDTLLGSLNNGLSQVQLIELERLFGRCGGFFAERKSVMVARLAREIEVYETYVNQLSTIVGENVSEEFQIEGWNNLSAAEKKQSELFSQLVTMQDSIISILLTGKSIDSPEMIETLREVKEIQETLAVTNQQVSKVRTQLISF